MESEISHLKISEDGMVETADTKAGPKTMVPGSTAATPRSASLDGLPTELKSSILYFAPNISTLRTLIRASPLYHKVYLDERKAILSAVLVRDIGKEVLTDALAVHEASQIGFNEPVGRNDGVKSFVSQYKVRRGSSSSATCDSLDIRTLESLSRLQWVITEITTDFCDTTISVHPLTGERVQSLGDLSSNEKRRIYRSFYRFELFRALFIEPFDVQVPLVPVQMPSESQEYFDAMDQSLLFLSIFKPWEVEELACVRDYIIRRYSGILQESSSELSTLCPNKDLNDDYWKIQNTGYLMSLGLPFLCRLLKVSSAAQRASILQYNIHCDRYFLTDALEEEPYDWVYPTDVNAAYEAGHGLLFEDDGIVDGPNAAWPWSTNQKVEIFYFEGHKRPLRKWAYVMWDLARLEDWKILDVSPEKLFDP